jgi:hypothetical protein
MDFFTIPTASPRVLYCWFVIHHRQRRVQKLSLKAGTA